MVASPKAEKLSRDLVVDHPSVFFSLSQLHSTRSAGFVDLVKALRPDRFLLESDWMEVDKLDGFASLLLA